MINKTIIVDRKGMITIPEVLRKKYNIHEGSQLVILDIEGELEIVPIYDDFTKIQQKLSSRKVIERRYNESIKKELELES